MRTHIYLVSVPNAISKLLLRLQKSSVTAWDKFLSHRVMGLTRGKAFQYTIQSVSKMLGQNAGVPHNKTKEIISLHVHKHLLFEVEPPRSPGLNPSASYL